MENDTEKQKPRGKGIKAKVQAQEKPQQTRAVRHTQQHRQGEPGRPVPRSGSQHYE